MFDFKSLFTLFLFYLIARPFDAVALANPVQPAAFEPLLISEFALQAGQLDLAAKMALRAAEQTPADRLLAQRATSIAFQANQTDLARQALILWRARAPAAMLVRSAQAALALRTKDWETSQRTLRNLLKDEQPRSWQYAVLAFLDGGDDDEALSRALEDLIRQKQLPHQFEVWQDFGQLAFRFGQPSLIEEFIDELAKQFPNEPRVVLLQAGQMQRTGHRQEALQLLRQIEPHARRDVDSAIAIALAYQRMELPVAAERVLAKAPQTIQIYSLRASLLASQNDRKGLHQLSAQLAHHRLGLSAERLQLLGQVAEFLKEPRQALAWYQHIQDGPLLVQAQMREIVLLDALGRHQQATDFVHELEENGDSATQHHAFVLESQLAARAKNFKEEQAVYVRALTIFPEDIELLSLRALSYEQQGDFAQAEADLRRCLAYSPEHPFLLNALGYFLANRTTRYDEALALIKRARAVEPNNPMIIDSYGWVLFKMGQLTAAYEALKHAWILDHEPDIGAHLAEVTWKMGDHQQATIYFDAVRRMDPDNSELRRALADCQP